MKSLVLNLKSEYFDAIKSGEKTEEFRLHCEFWIKRLVELPSGKKRQFSHIEICRGYPKRGDMTRRIIRPWRGLTLKHITHPHFGPEPVTVFAIVVN